MILVCLAPCLAPLLLLRRRERSPANPGPVYPLTAVEVGYSVEEIDRLRADGVVA